MDRRPGALFDFDGTLVDTFGGIVEGVQRMRARLDAGPLDFEEAKRHIGWGLKNLVGQCHPRMDALRPDELPADGSPLPLEEALLHETIELFRAEYQQCQMHQTRVYAGIPALCTTLAERDVALAVVSNKPERFVRHIMAALGLADPFALVLGGDSLPTLKPHPAPLLHAIDTLGIDRARCAMVGDSDLDIRAARAAQLPSIAVGWGIQPPETLRPSNPTYLVDTTADLLQQIRRVLGLANRPVGSLR